MPRRKRAAQTGPGLFDLPAAQAQIQEVENVRIKDGDIQGAGLGDILGSESAQLVLGSASTLASEGRWQRLDSFNARSQKQVLKLISILGHPTPQDRWGRITTGKIEIDRLYRKTGHPVYKAILEGRELKTMRDSFVGQWEPGPDGRVHSQFASETGTGQHNSKHPNAQNTPKHTRLASAFNRMIEVPPGHKFVVLDWKSFHVVTLAFESQDQVLMRVAMTDPHTFATAHFLKVGEPDRLLDLPDNELAAKLKWIRSCGGGCTHSEIEKHEGKCWGWMRDAKVKHSLLGYNNGMGPHSLFYAHREAFSGLNEVRKLLDLMDRLFAKAAAWRRQIARVAHKQRYLTSRWGFTRQFYCVFEPTYDGRSDPFGDPKHGDDYEAALTFLIQNDAHGYRNDAMIRLDEAGQNERYGLVDEIHDDLRYCCREELVDACLHEVSAEMVKRQPVLTDPVMAPDGLWCDVDAKVGRNWDKKSEGNPDGLEEIFL